MKFQRHISLFALVMSFALLLPGAALAGYDEGVTAYKNKNYATALQEFKLLASQGNANAQFFLAAMYGNGQGVPQDDKESVKWYRLAAVQGNVLAQHDLGVMYRTGQRVPQDYKEAVRWFRLAAAQGNANAQHNLGVMYGTGQGVSASYVIAYALFNLSAAIDSSKNNKATELRAVVFGLMQPDEINAAQDLTRELEKPGNLLNALDNYVKASAFSKR